MYKMYSFIIMIFKKLIFILFLLKPFNSQFNEEIMLNLYSSNKPDSNPKFSFIEDLHERNLFTTINIGQPQYEIKTFLTVQNEYMGLIPNKNLNENISYTKYNYSKSETFKNIKCLNEFFFESRKDILAEEKFTIKSYNYKNNKTSEIFLNNFNFIMGVNDKYINNEYYLKIGLKIIMQYKNKEKQGYNFIDQLKERKFINNYCWCIFFEKGKNENGNFLYNPEELFNSNGKLIIGDLPNVYWPNKFHKSQLLTTYSYDKDLIDSWGVEFNNIYHYDNNNKTVKDMFNSAYLDINNYLVQAPQTYYTQMKTQFFKEYLSKHICNIYSGYGFESIYCDKSENFTLNNLKEFPTIYFQNNELQYIFELNYEDLFVEKENKFWFLVTFPTFYELEEWYFGIIFLRKYNLIFNPDSKTIGFYNPNLPIVEEEDENSNHKNNTNNNKVIKIIIIIIVLLIIISIGLGFYLGKILYFNKSAKKRFNELEDNFEYESDENKEQYYEKNKNNSIGIEIK